MDVSLLPPFPENGTPAMISITAHCFYAPKVVVPFRADDQQLIELEALVQDFMHETMMSPYLLLVAEEMERLAALIRTRADNVSTGVP